MAFVVEDGTGIENANAYIAVAVADTYHADRGHASWAPLSNSIKQACIVRATDYVEKRFGIRFIGNRSSRAQALEWPRFNAVDSDGYLLVQEDEVPRKLQQAVAEYALRAAVYSELAPDPLLPVPAQDFTGASLPDQATDHGPGAVAEKLEKVDVVEESTRYVSPIQRLDVQGGKLPTSSLVAAGNIPEYPAADMLIEGLLRLKNRRLLRG